MGDSWLRLLAVVALVGINAVFVAAEFALVTVRATRIDQLVAAGNRRARIVQRAQSDPNRFISAAQVGITMASLGLGWIAEPALAGIFSPLLEPALGHNSRIGSHVIAGVVAYFVVTLFHIVLGEQVPKMVALQRAEATILTTAPPVAWISVPFRPFIWLLSWLTNFILRLFGLESQGEHHEVYSEDELRMLVAVSQQKGLIDKSEQELIARVFGFADVAVEEVMVPRTEMIAIPIDADLDDVVKAVASSGHARFPVYGDDPDDILGIFYAKDLYRVLASRQEHRFLLRRIVRAPMTVPATMDIDDLLARMKRDRTQIAIVVDEYGGTAGMVTLEDVVERIVGDLDDEFERPTREVQELDNGEYRVSGLMSVDDFGQRFGIEIDEPYYLTIGGYVFGQLGRRPEPGDQVLVDAALLRIESMDGLRIDRLRVLPAGAASATPESPLAAVEPPATTNPPA